MMTVTYLRRPVHLKVLWWFQERYLRLLLWSAEKDREAHRRELKFSESEVERLEGQIDVDANAIEALTLRLQRVLQK